MFKLIIGSKYTYLIVGSLMIFTTQACAASKKMTNRPVYGMVNLAAASNVDAKASANNAHDETNEETSHVSVSPAAAGAFRNTGVPTPQKRLLQQVHVSKDKTITENKPSERSTHAMLIYTGGLSLRIEETNMPALIDRIINEAELLGGHLMKRTNTSITIKVPSPHFRQAMAKVEALAEVTERSVSAQDVTEEYLDLEIRLKNLQATRERLQEFFARAKNVDEALAVERELERVSQEIDRAQGRLKYLQSHVAFSSIHVTLEPKTSSLIVAKGTPPPARVIALPVRWLNDVGLNSLLNLVSSSR